MDDNRLDMLARARDPQKHPNQRPRDAATLIVLDRSGARPHVLMGRRRHDLAFMPGALVFPGGRVEPEDRSLPVAAPLHPVVDGKLQQNVQRPSPAKARGYAQAALRETFEETGLRHPEPPDLSGLRFVARAVTPPRLVRRFDTRFFTIDADALQQQAEVVGPDAELTELVWLPLDAMDSGPHAITRVVLQELRERLARGFDPELPVPFYRVLHRRFTRSEL